jgi:tetratricopeptide (TPR) repeat protein
MLLATVVLSAALAPQAPPAEPLPPEPSSLPEVAAPEAAPGPAPEEPAPALAVEPVPAETVEPAPAMATEAVPASVSTTQEHIDAGLKAFIRGRFSRAQGEFEKAYDADPQSAAAAFYLGYACYKIGEPSRRMDPEKQRAKELFAKAYSLDPAFMPVWRTKKE